MRFCDHAEVGSRLADHLVRLAPADPAVVAIPSGGVRIGWEIARRLGAPMDVLLVTEVSIPGPCGLPVGCVAGGKLYPDRESCHGHGITADYVQILATSELKEQVRRERTLRRGERPLDLRGRTVILVSDGSPTPLALRTAVAAIRERGAREVLYAAPVADSRLHDLVGSPAWLITMFRPDEFRSVMVVNAGNRQTTDEEIAGVLSEARRSQRQLALA